MRTWVLAEQMIADAERRGELKNLPGEGKPLAVDQLQGLDEDARFDAQLRRTTGGASLELELRKEIAALRERLDAEQMTDADRSELKQKLVDKVVQLSIVHESNGHRLLANSALDFMPG